MDRNIGFDEKNFAVLLKYEDWHWWFQRRNDLIKKTMVRFSTVPSDILEIGCGNGLVTKAIQDSYPKARITGTEYFEDGLENARQRVSGVSFKQLDARDMGSDDKFDAICAFDVLEHIDADVEVMSSIRSAMKDTNSRFYITVPQHMALWSQADTAAQHERRYSYKDMQLKLKKAGFEVEYRSSYVVLLSPLMFLSRLLSRSAHTYDVESEFAISKFTNTVLSGVMRVEAALRSIGLPMPFGGSLVVVARPV